MQSELEKLQFFQTLVENSRDLMWRCDPGGIFVYLNPAWEQLFGYTLAEMLGRRFSDFLASASDDTSEREFDELRQGQQLKGVRGVMLGKDNREIQLLGDVWPIFDANGAFLGTRGIAYDITERQRAEKIAQDAMETLAESEERYKVAFHTFPDALSITSLEGIYQEINPGFTAHTGYTAEEVIGRSSLELNIWVDPRDRDRLTGGLREHGRVSNLEANFRRKDGSILTGLMSASICKIRNVPHILSTSRDISERKKYEHELEMSARRYRMLIELAMDAFFQGDEQGNFIDANTTAVELTGYSRDELLRMNMRDLFSPETLKNVPLRYDRLDHGESLASQRELRTKSGQPRLIEMHSKRMPDGTYQAFFHDITRRKQIEDAAAAEKERLAVTLRSIGDGVITTDTLGRVQLVNRVAEQLTGWCQQEAEGRPLPEVFRILDERSREPAATAIDAVLATAVTVDSDIPVVLVARDGSERLVARCGSPLMDRNNAVIGAVLVFRDMTEKTRLLEITQNNQKLEALGVLAGGIAHDFNNLLGGIFGSMELAQVACHDPRVLGYLNGAIDTIKRARSLTQQLLTFAKGGTPLRSLVPLPPLIRESAQFALSGSNVSCRFQLPDDLWPCSIDANQIGQVLDNIVINAQQAMPAGGEILITAENLTLTGPSAHGLPAGKYVRISIADTGIGIPRDILPRIFDPFFTTKSKGQGLGLATSHSILRRHNGGIEAESEPGRGSTFHIFLPATSKPISQTEPPLRTSHIGRGRVLVMDDEPVVRDVLASFLELFGYVVIAMAEGKAALAYVEAEIRAGRTFAALFLDLTIPGGLGGKEIIAGIRDQAPALPVFVVSGYAEDPIMAAPARFGFTASLRKPFLMEELEQLLAVHMPESSPETDASPPGANQ
ncbi:MAG TPA: PAS domain S-box protein [Candidatus Ozemobacteraceae bacterium]|nr:PAS domain S-box protein [Candidatus Ozemobacteraceae bacterium]